MVRGIYDGIGFPVIFKQYQGKKLLDILNTGWSPLFLISDKLKVLLEQADLTGWTTYPIRLFDKKENIILGYHGFSVIVRCGPTYYDDSTIFEKQFVPTGPFCKQFKGMFFDINTWDKSDFFMPTETDPILITKKVAEILIKNKVTNVDLENLMDVETDIKIAKR